MAVKAAATDYEGEMELNVATIPLAIEWGSKVSFSGTEAIYRCPDDVWGKETIATVTLNQVLESNHIKHIDFVSIDVEGQEMVVFCGFDLHKWQPHLIVAEYSDTKERHELLEYLKLQDYSLWSDNGQDTFVVRGSKMAHLNILFKG